ncbi:hypothetical protein NMG60_11004536 [Bertholletia excelsa]
MEALGLGLPPLNSLCSSSRRSYRIQECCKLSPRAYGLDLLESSRIKGAPSSRTRPYSFSIRMQAVGEDFELRQMKDMAAAKKRWDAMMREGKVKILTPREAGYAVQLSNKTLLDVRPSSEHEKAWVKGSTWIPIFEVDNGFDIGIISRKITNFMMGGWWSGVPTLSYNVQFLPKVEEKFPKDADLIVACQKGLRSLAACELLYNAGYRNLFWVQGGLEAAEEEDLEREGPLPFRLAGIGGVSEFLGFTDQQRVAAAKEGWGYRLVFTARLVGVLLVADALFIGAQQVGHYLQDVRSH